MVDVKLLSYDIYCYYCYQHNLRGAFVVNCVIRVEEIEFVSIQ